MFGARKVRKTSPEPETRHSLQFDSKNGHSGSTIGRRRRRRNEFVTKGPPKILPLYIQGSTPSMATLGVTPSSACHSFLLGGHYYPGKDKKARHMRKRTVWYRICCSSTQRQTVSIVVVCILFWYIIVPFHEIVYDYGLLMSSGYRHVGLEVPQTTLELPDIGREKALFHKIQALHQADEVAQIRSDLLEHMVPEWFHRNGKMQEARDGIEKTQQRHKHKQKKHHSDKHNNDSDSEQHQEEKQEEASTSDADKPSEATGAPRRTSEPTDSPTLKATDPPSERTLHTMDYFPNLSQCPDSVDASMNTTLVMQCSLDRLWILSETCKRWKDPIVMVVHLTKEQVQQNKTAALKQQWEATCPQMTLVGYEAEPSEQEWGYPVNKLRNAGLDAVQTSHILVADVDFVPSLNLDDTIRQVVLERSEQHEVTNSTLKDRDAIVVPAFERILTEPCHTISECSTYLKFNSDFIPATLDSLRNCMNQKHCSVFQGQVNWEGHHSTNSMGWLKGHWYESEEITLRNGAVSKPIKKVKCFDSLRYEPYVVLRWCPHDSTTANSDTRRRQRPRPLAPYYDERFFGYGKNKIEMISHLRFLGYQFSILPRGFIVHNPHPESLAKKTWLDVKDYKLHENMDALYPQFLKELWKKYGNAKDSKNFVQQCNKG